MGTLNQYLAEKKIRQEDFAAEIGVTQATVSRFTRQKANPSLEVASRIAKATGGAVPITSWPNIAAIIEAAQQGVSQ